jgi:four helix bundle protein
VMRQRRIRFRRWRRWRYGSAMSHSFPPAEPSRNSDSRDPLARMQVYQLSKAMVSDASADAEKLSHHAATKQISGQLYAAIGSIMANLGEGYSRSSGRDRSRIFEYALGSTREAIAWYRAAEPLLGEAVATERVDRLESIRRLLMAIIPRERGRLIRPATEPNIVEPKEVPP